MLLPDAVKPFLADNTGALRSNESIRSYRQALYALAAAHPKKHLKQYTEQDLVTWVQSRLEAGGEPSPNYIRQRIKVLKRFFRWAARRGLVTIDPAASLSEEVKVPAKTVRKHNWLTEVQIEHVLASCPDSEVGARDRVLLTIGFFTALRNHEIAGLRWGDIDLGSGKLHVLGKGAKHAEVGLPRRLQAELEKLRVQAEERLGRPVRADDPVLPSAQRQWMFADEAAEIELLWEKPLGPSGCYRAVKKAAVRAGLPAVAPHDMRRSLAGILDKRGVAITEVRDVLRHDGVGTTERYLEKNPARAVSTLRNFEL